MAAAIGRDIVSAQGFWDKPEKDQVTALSAVSPKFKASNPQVQRETLQALRKTVGGKGLSPAGKPPEPTPQREQPPQNGRAATNPAPSATPDSPAPPKPESDPSKLPENQPGIHLPSLDEFGRIAKGWATGGYGSIQQAVKPGIEKAAGWVAGEIPKLAGAPKEAQEFTSGIGQGLAEMGVDMTTPANIAMISAMVFGGELAEGGKLATGAPKVAKLLKAIPWAAKQGFRGAQGLDAFRQVGGFEEAYNKKDYREAGKAVARFISDAVLIKMAGKSGKKSVPLEDKMPPGGGEPPVSEHDTSQAKPQEGLDRARHHKIPQPEKYSKIEAEEERLREEAAKKSVAGEPAARPPEPTPSKSSTPPPEPTKASPPKAQTPVPTTEPPKAPPVEAQKPAITLPATPPSEPAQEPRRPVEPPKPANPEDKIAANNKRIAELEARLRAGEKPAPPPEPTPQTPARGKVEKQKAIGASTEARSLERSVSAEEAKKSRPVQPPVKSKTSGAPANPPPEKVATPEAPKANEGSGAPVPPEHAELHQVVGSIFAQATAGNLEGVKLTAKDATGKTLVALEFDADNPARNVTDMLSRFRGIKSIEVDPIGGKATGLKRWTKFLTGQEIKGPPLNMPARGAPAKP